ncbi:MAG TPA: transglycosylase domain-containing protein [Solirubrobacteraceae bacterium]|nr:transglycosylase domain-containing protein [Solirubrobacteraceae bacterium]
MSVAEQPPIATLPAPAPRRRRPRLKKLRLTLIVVGLAFLAVVSTVFGMMMAVASDLPALESLPQYRSAKNSVLVDDQGRRLGLLVSNQNRILVASDQISSWMKDAIIAIEDKRFYSNSGVDIRGIARAFVADVTKQGGTQGGSTITQQFVKVALQAEGKRTIFEKLREAALAYHLTRKWSKDRILTEYLNSVYFGNGAYGIESAARTYFKDDHPHCGEPGHPMCAKLLTPTEAALIAGVVQNPSGYDPLYRPAAAKTRRNTVLRAMLDQGYITPAVYRDGLTESLPIPHQPNDESLAPYFTSWVRQQLVDKYGPHAAFEGGLRVRTTLDMELQREAQAAIADYLPTGSGLPSAALVAIDNETGGVRAMVGGSATTGAEFTKSPFNLATQGQRQPGSSFKAFVLATALGKGISPSSVWLSQKFTKILKGGEVFTVRNDEGSYVGPTTLANATYHSDNTVFERVGYQVGFANIARTARAMGIRTPVSTNPAMAIGGLNPGVTVLDMAHAYETLAMGGVRVEGTLGAGEDPYNGAGGPVGIISVRRPGGKVDRNKRVLHRVVPSSIVAQEVPLLEGVVKYGTGRLAGIPGVVVAGKTGTTDNYVDAWFVGFTDRLTVAVWVGYPDSAKPMKTQYRGEPVLGGTYPAAIWRDFVVQALDTYKARQQQRLAAEAAKQAAEGRTTTGTTALTTGTTALTTETSGATTSGETTTAPSERHKDATTPQTTTPSSDSGEGATTTPQAGPSIGGVQSAPATTTPSAPPAETTSAAATPPSTPATPTTPAAPATPGATGGAGAG